MNSPSGSAKKISGYAPINGLKMYYEIEGTGDPLVFISSRFWIRRFGIFPCPRSEPFRHCGRPSGQRSDQRYPRSSVSIEQYAKDVVDLLKYLGIAKADFFGESYGGDTAALIAVRYPEVVRRVATYSATFGPAQ